MYIEGDVPTVTTGNNCNSGFMNGDGWWAIILFALIFGWGRGGYGYGGSQGGGVMDGYVLTSDFASIERKLDNVNNGICDGFYAMNTGMLNGFAGVTSAITAGGYETRSAINGIGSQLADCCCKTQSAIKDTQYAIAMQTNAIQQSLCTGFRDVIDSQNANYRALHDEIVANRIEDKNAQIAAQQNEINALRLKASQTEQNTFLVSALRPQAQPAYVVPNPNCCYSACGTTGTCGSVL